MRTYSEKLLPSSIALCWLWVLFPSRGNSVMEEISIGAKSHNDRKMIDMMISNENTIVKLSFSE